MVLSVRERFDTSRPVRSARACRDCGRASRIRARSARFLFESTFPRLSADGNQIFGSSLAGFTSPRAIAMLRAFIASTLAMPIRSVGVVLRLRITLARNVLLSGHFFYEASQHLLTFLPNL